jgi:acyl carrier protein
MDGGTMIGCKLLPIFMELPPKLKKYIDNNRGSLPAVTDPDEPLQLDSLGLIRLVAFLENDIGYRVEDEEIIAANSRPCSRLASYLRLKRRLGRHPKPNFPERAAHFQPFRSPRMRLDMRNSTAVHIAP